jgi:hypothetical protein
VIIRCHVCRADPAGRWKQSSAMMFADGVDADGHRRFACRDHLSAKREAEIATREKALGWSPGGLR